MTAWRNFNIRSQSKYRSEKTEIDGNIFDSKKEAKRYQQLKLLEAAGEIKDLRTQVKYVLIPTQREPDTIGKRGGVHKGKLLEKECAYYADFVYTRADTGETVVEDAKGMRLSDYKLKRKMMLFFHGIKVSEI